MQINSWWLKKYNILIKLYLATDLDRKEESIVWHIKEFLRLNNHFMVTYTEKAEKAGKRL
jgi:DNA topoisomerase IA